MFFKNPRLFLFLLLASSLGGSRRGGWSSGEVLAGAEVLVAEEVGLEVEVHLVAGSLYLK